MKPVNQFVYCHGSSRWQLTSSSKTCTTGMSLISHYAHCWLSLCQYTVNTPLIVDESFVLLKREGRSIETISSEGKQVRLHTNSLCSHLFKSYADSSINRNQAISYCVLWTKPLEVMEPTGHLISGTQYKGHHVLFQCHVEAKSQKTHPAVV